MEQVHVSMTRRSTADSLRALAQEEASVLFTGELARRQEEWRGALASVQHTLAGLEATGDAVVGASRDAVSALIEKIVAAAATEAETLAQQVEADARAIAEAQALAERLQADVGAGQEQLRLAREELGAEQAARASAEAAAKDAQAARARAEAAAKDAQAARAHAEAAAKDAQAAHDQARAALETQLRSRDTELQSIRGEVTALQEQLAAGQAERANLTATLQALQSAVHGAVSTLSHIPPAPSLPREAAAPAPAPRAASSSPGAPPERRAAILKVLPADRPRNIGVYVTALLESVEAMHAQDVASALPPAEVIRRLTDNLRYASRLLTERLGSDPAAENRVFRDEVTKLLVAKGATPFGRDLAIAAGEAERHERRDRTARAQVPDEASA